MVKCFGADVIFLMCERIGRIGKKIAPAPQFSLSSLKNPVVMGV